MVYIQKCMGSVFQKLPYHFLQNQKKGKGRKIMKYLLHKLDIYYRFVIGRYHIRWDTSCSRRKPAIFPKVTFHEWNSVVICIFTLHFDMQTTAVGLCHFGPPTHTHWQSADTSPLKEVKWDMFIMKHYAIITYSMIKQSLCLGLWNKQK